MDVAGALTVFNRVAETGFFSAMARETNTNRSAAAQETSDVGLYLGPDPPQSGPARPARG